MWGASCTISEYPYRIILNITRISIMLGEKVCCYLSYMRTYVYVNAYINERKIRTGKSNRFSLLATMVAQFLLRASAQGSECLLVKQKLNEKFTLNSGYNVINNGSFRFCFSPVTLLARERKISLLLCACVQHAVMVMYMWAAYWVTAYTECNYCTAVGLWFLHL